MDCLRNAQRLTPLDRVTLTWYEKWQKHGRFPWKFVFHVALLVFSTWQIVLLNHEDAQYFRAIQRNWMYFFFPEDFDFDKRSYYIYDLDSTLDSIRNAVEGVGKVEQRH